MSEDSPASEAGVEKLAEQREREADELRRRSEKLRSEVSDARDDWARKRSDANVPGAPAPEGEADAEPASGAQSEAAAAHLDQPGGESGHGGEDTD
jgi:hypothetical protein